MLRRSFLLFSALAISCGGQELNEFDSVDPLTAGLASRQDFSWRPAAGPRGASVEDPLLRGLYESINGNAVLGYDRARDLLFTQVEVRDGWIECIYSGATTRRSGRVPSGWNCEHSWPQSQLDKKPNPRSDLHHLFPITQLANSARGDWDFGETTDQPKKQFCDVQGGCSRVGTCGQAGQTVFEVRPARRGDLARAHFYMVARYRYDPKVQLDDDRNPGNGSISDGEEAVLRRWHREDPVDARERERNGRIEKLQGNRNPFVDDPSLVDQILNF